VRFGLFLLSPQFPHQTHRQALDATVAAAVAAEEAGFDDVWVAEHHFMSYGVCPSALTLAGYLLGVTRRVRVGTAATILSTQHPLAVAEQVLLLDQLSGGRLVLGVGRGGPWVDLHVFGGPGVDRRADFPEALDVLLAALTGRPVHGPGPAYPFPEVTPVPGPHTRPRPDVVVAATSDATVALAADRRLPLLLGMHVGDEDKAAAVAAHARIAGPTNGHVSVHLAHVADSDEQARAEVRALLPAWLRPGLAGYRRADGAPRPARDPDAYAALLCRLHPVGSPQLCRERLARTAARTGVRHAVLAVDVTGDPRRSRETIRRLGDEVLPELRGAP
jgi:alkanesulfonate monooxygenase SsuD/methylene tetrahydromethanopterin reductase-like flavin-dependent oxidoreductase (luciferase family)